MANRQYTKGIYYERRTIALCLSMGAVDARRTAGSHGAYDVIAIFPDHVKLIQVKSGRARDDGKLARLEVPPGIVKEMWKFDARARSHTVITIPST